MSMESFAKFIVFIKINIFDIKNRMSKIHDQISNFALTKYKLQEFVKIGDKIYALYTIRPMRHPVKTELKIIFKEKRFLKSFSKDDMVNLFYAYVKNNCERMKKDDHD